jgi:hypothetical protein
MLVKKSLIFIALIAMFVTGILSGKILELLGDTDSTSDPGNTSSYTLKDIYDRLNDGTEGSQITFTEPASGPGSVMYDLNDIMAAAPQADNSNGATATEVVTGKTFWGLNSGVWGLQTGSAAEGNDVSGAEGNSTFPIPDGFYSGKTAIASDADLLAENIKDGINIFDITGTLTGGTSYNAAVPKTGASRSFTTGDDGDLQKGVPWPNPRFTDNGNGTVTDNLTGLIWLKDANPCEVKKWADAVSYCNGLATGTAGLSDGSSAGAWRLANIRELFSLVHYDIQSPLVPSPFTHVQETKYWSSTRDSYGDPLYFSFSRGGIGNESLYSFNYVWPVRGGQ